MRDVPRGSILVDHDKRDVPLGTNLVDYELYQFWNKRVAPRRTGNVRGCRKMVCRGKSPVIFIFLLLICREPFLFLACSDIDSPRCKNRKDHQAVDLFERQSRIQVKVSKR